MATLDDITTARNEAQHLVPAPLLKAALQAGPYLPHVTEKAIALLKSSFEDLYGVGYHEVSV